MSTIEKEEREEVSAIIEIGHGLVDIIKILLLLAEKWEIAEKRGRKLKLEIVKTTNNKHCGNQHPYTRILGHGEEGEGLGEKLQELVSIAHTLEALSQGNQEVEVIIFLA